MNPTPRKRWQLLPEDRASRIALLVIYGIMAASLVATVCLLLYRLKYGTGLT